MKKKFLLTAIITSTIFIACKKTENSSNTTLTASATQVAAGQSVTLNVSTDKNAVSWTVTPSASVTKQFTITTQKINTVSFRLAGTYVVGVRARDISYDSTRHQNLDSCWHNGGGDRGGCTKGKDSSSVSIKVF